MNIYVNLTTREFIACKSKRNANMFLGSLLKKLTPTEDVEEFDIGMSRWKRNDRIIQGHDRHIPYLVCEFLCVHSDAAADADIRQIKRTYTTKMYVVRKAAPDVVFDF
jgi:hypothetical protein